MSLCHTLVDGVAVVVSVFEGAFDIDDQRLELGRTSVGHKKPRPADGASGQGK